MCMYVKFILTCLNYFLSRKRMCHGREGLSSGVGCPCRQIVQCGLRLREQLEYFYVRKVTNECSLHNSRHCFAFSCTQRFYNNIITIICILAFQFGKLIARVISFLFFKGVMLSKARFTMLLLRTDMQLISQMQVQTLGVQ